MTKSVDAFGRLEAVLVANGSWLWKAILSVPALSPHERVARLMGVPDTYVLPANYNEAYHLMGDGLAVPVVAWLEKHLLRPLALGALRAEAA